MSALWRVSLMLQLNPSLLNREYVPINALKALVSIVFMCNLHVIFLDIDRYRRMIAGIWNYRESRRGME
jgi:hypothetical protein